LKVVGAMALILKDAIKPNIVQNFEHMPGFIHAGPFANIAHGNSSILATKLALKLADYVITEGGFAAELGFEKFVDIVTRKYNVFPSVVVLVASIRALHIHGGVAFEDSTKKNLEALKKGLANLDKHIENVTKKFKVPLVVAINRFPFDNEEEIEYVKKHCAELGVKAVVSEVYSKGGEGGIELAEAVEEALNNNKVPKVNFIYDLNDPITTKIEKLAKELYGAEGVEYSSKALSDIKRIEELGYAHFPICMAKTQLSISDKKELLGAPTNWKLQVDEVRLYTGAEFIVPVCGNMFLMPGLPAVPAAEKMDVTDDGKIIGLK